jgi:acyl carrier protein/GNAT superfamily N-acetyltransferase
MARLSDRVMTPQAIRGIVLDTIRSLALEASAGEAPPDRPLRDALELDSLDWLNFIAGLEDRLSIRIPPTDHGRLATVDAIVDYVAALPVRGADLSRPEPLSASTMSGTRHSIRGTPVAIRPMREDDLALEAEFVRHLSPLSRYRRFMVSLNELPQTKLEALTRVDQDHHVALVAETMREGKPALIGVVRYAVDASGRSCEFAVAVDDDWQRSGLAGVLMHALMGVARSRGLTSMEGLVLRSNERMLKLSRQLGFTRETDPADPRTVRVRRLLRP